MSAKPVPIDRQIANQAARWFLHLQNPGASDQDRQACAQWRDSHSDHERAWQLAQRFSEQLHGIPPALGRSTLHRAETLNRRSTLKALTSLVVLGSLGIAASRSPTMTHLTADISTDIGERRRMTLSDGTQLHLNTDSAVDIDYNDTTRRLVLRRGEVMIVTAADEAGRNRPFFVESSRGRFQPLGTRFALRQLADHDQLNVFEGAVAATPADAAQQRTTIQAGQQARISTHDVILQQAHPYEADWIDGVLRVRHMRLADFAHELSRYRRGWIRCAPAVADVLVSGVFQLQNTDQALAALALAFPVRARYVTRYWVTLGPA